MAAVVTLDPQWHLRAVVPQQHELREHLNQRLVLARTLSQDLDRTQTRMQSWGSCCLQAIHRQATESCEPRHRDSLTWRHWQGSHQNLRQAYRATAALPAADPAPVQTPQAGQGQLPAFALARAPALGPISTFSGCCE